MPTATTTERGDRSGERGEGDREARERGEHASFVGAVVPRASTRFAGGLADGASRDTLGVPLHRALRRIAALAVVLLPMSLIGRAGAMWSTPAPAPPREPRTFATTELASARVSEDRDESAVVLVVLDGVRWQEFFGGADRALERARGMNPATWAGERTLLPNVAKMLETRAVAIGAPSHGAAMGATGPQFISLPGYMEIFAGRADTGCDSNECARRPSRTVVDDVLDASGPDDAAVVTSWPNIARAASSDASRVVMTAGRHHVDRAGVLRADPETASLLDRGANATPFPGEGDYRPDAITARVALRVLEARRPRFLFVGLGDADEYAHQNDYLSYLEAVHFADAFLGDLLGALDGMGARGQHTTVLVTADHGRAYDFKDHGRRYPESGRVFLLAAGGDVRGHGLVAAERRHTLSDIAPTVRALLGMSGEGEPIAEVARTVGTRATP
jgi:hypothetical protein